MNGFIIFIIFAFVVVPTIKNLMKSNPKSKQKNRQGRPAHSSRTKSGGSTSGQKNWAQVQELLQQKMAEQKNQSKRNPRNRRDSRGHSGARAQTHENLHKGDGDTNVFTASHQNRVLKRERHDRSERNRIEAMLHSKTNRSIERVDNKGIDTWGARGDKGMGSNFILLIAILIALAVVASFAPSLLEEIKNIANK